MPPGAKKRKALKKKKQQQQEATGTSNGDNLHGGNEEHGSQDDRESDSNLSSPGSQEFGWTKDPSVAMVKETAKEISDVTQGLRGPESGNNAIAVERGIDDKKTTIVENSGSVIAVEKKFIVDKSHENIPQTAKNLASQDPCDKEIAPVVDSVSEVVISEKGDHAETSTHSHLLKQKEFPFAGLEKDNGKVVATLPAGTSKRVECIRESEAPLSSEEKRLLLPGPPAVRTSWLSCCGLFDAMTGSDR
ncbi:hypothetical protein N665_1089s0019 [Sinapis alba]|nr:hypothetical protein N665_1089s0019 [Sinapis alba]